MFRYVIIPQHLSSPCQALPWIFFVQQRELSKEVLIRFTDPLGDSNHNLDVLITAAPAFQVRHPLPLKPEQLAALSPLGYGHGGDPVHGRDLDLCPEGGLTDRDRDFAIEVIPLSLKEGVGCDHRDDIKVTGSSAPDAGAPFSCNTHLCPVINAGRDLD